jgi:predicted MPP superfamily phosphohydrolase
MLYHPVVPDQLQILHVSDLHAHPRNKDDMTLRLAALFDDLQEERVKPDLIVFSGDLANSGEPDEYALAFEEFLTPLMNRLQLGPESVILVPGNHDVFRGSINAYHEDGLRADLTTSRAAENAFFNDPDALLRLGHYRKFVSDFYGLEKGHFYTEKRSLRGIEIGIGALNSAWRCSDDTDKGRLFLTEKQIVHATAQLRGCDLSIGILHHPTTWLHESESETVIPDLHNEFNVLLSGHIHIPVSESTTSPNGTCIHLTTPALSDGRKEVVGYNYYTIDIAQKQLLAHYRKFIRNGRRFDADTNHAKGGRCPFPLPVQNINRFSNRLLVQKIGQAGTAIQTQLDTLLSKHQGLGKTLYVAPPVGQVRILNGEKHVEPCSESVVDVLRRFTFITGPSESGKSILCHSIAAEINRRSFREGSPHSAILIDLKRSVSANLKQQVLEAIRSLGSAEDNVPVVVVLDHIYESGDFHIKAIADLAATRPNWSFVVTISGSLVFETLLASYSTRESLFLQLKLWGPSRIKQVAQHVLEDTGVDIQAAFEFVINSLKHSDLPSTPLVVFMYLTVFASLEGEVTSLSFLHLLQEYERIKIGKSVNTGSRGLYNKQKILALAAAEMIVTEESFIPRDVFLAKINNYFQEFLLDVDADALIREFCAAGILEDSGAEISFSLYVFFDYYAAIAFQESYAPMNNVRASIDSYAYYSDALALYAGLSRADERLARDLISLIDKHYKPRKSFDLKDLEKKLESQFLPADDPDSVDQVATRDLSSTPDYDAMDEDFEAGRGTYSFVRARPAPSVLSTESSSTQLEELSRLTSGLVAFYKLFRNLENLKGPVKVELLDRILDHHIVCNINVIDYFHKALKDVKNKTLFAYIATLSGQQFLFSYAGNQTLGQAIDQALVRTKSRLKRLLLASFYGDLRLPGYESRVEEQLNDTESFAAVELIYTKVRMWMISYEGTTIPTRLVSLFEAAFTKRQEIAKKLKISSGTAQDFPSILRQVKRDHLLQIAERDFL